MGSIGTLAVKKPEILWVESMCFGACINDLRWTFRQMNVVDRGENAVASKQKGQA